jgi:large-conductance mechanosensitive channel
MNVIGIIIGFFIVAFDLFWLIAGLNAIRTRPEVTYEFYGSGREIPRSLLRG